IRHETLLSRARSRSLTVSGRRGLQSAARYNGVCVPTTTDQERIAATFLLPVVAGTQTVPTAHIAVSPQ
ncbi:MAG: hypothetical protein ACE10G_13510, partial [Gemmatimonadales bacterium]